MTTVSDTVPSEPKAKISTAVRNALAKHGYARLTTAKIAAECDMTEAGLYYHYDSKDAMIVAFLDTATGFLKRELADLDAKDPETRLRQACERLFVTYDDEPRRRVNIAVMELLSHAPYNETLREPLLDLEASNLAVLHDIVATGIDQGVFRDTAPDGVAAFLLAAANGSTGFYLALGMEDAGADLHDAVSAYIDSLVA